MKHLAPRLGVGLGLRSPLYSDIMNNKPSIDFLEIVADQYIYATPEKMELLLETGKQFPLITHSIGLSLGTDSPVDEDYLQRTLDLAERLDASWFSDHICFTKTSEVDIGQLTPLWFTEESVETLCRNINHVKRRTNRLFLLENITYYFPIPLGEMTEAEFISSVLEKTDCGMLLDLNNVHVNSVNLGYDPYEFLKSIPLDRVVQVHIAGGAKVRGIDVDTHGAAVPKEVWDILRYVVANSPVKGILLERDSNFPAFQELLDELSYARRIFNGGN